MLFRNNHVFSNHVISDCAGCYRNAKLISSLPSISRVTKVDIVRYFFSEPQHGKSHADRGAALVKGKIRAHLNSGNNIETADDIVMAIRGVHSSSNVMAFRGCEDTGQRLLIGVQDGWDLFTQRFPLRQLLEAA